MKEQFTENPDDIFGEQSESKTAFNSALDIIQRISRLEYTLSSCLLAEDLIGSYKLLILIDSEIDFKLKDEEREDLKKDEDEVYKNLKKAEEKFYYEGNRYIKNPELREEVIQKLMNLKKKISRYKYKVGLGMIDQSDPRYALLNG
jgi:hypothetical protein